MRSSNRPAGAIRAALLTLGVLALPTFARAQDPADGIFDAPAKKAEAKDGDAKKAEPPKPGGGTEVSDRDSIGFTQENVASQMVELEERMFRLSEALRSLEPENASRLRLALKFSREELILQQMKETQGLMKEAQLAKAETEVRELLAKLEHLRSLLLAQDLDFQLKLARLRQMRETLAQLDRIIREERRELAWSRSAIEQGSLAKQMRSKKAELEGLIRDQEGVLAKTRDAAKTENEAARTEAKGAARAGEEGARKAAAGLAADPFFANQQPPHLKEADPHLEDALAHLGTPDTDAAIASEQQALDLFKKELERLDAKIAESEKSASEPEFRKFEQDQARNRGATDTLGQVSARLGDSGIALQKDLIRASGAMQGAEGNLAKTEAKPAADDQQTALKHLDKSRNDLAQAMEKMLVELRTELQARIVAELTEMHEIQGAIRESTEAQAPRAAQKSRTALIALAGLAKKEAELAERTELLLALVEETEFGIALPTSLRVLSREMRSVEDRLKEGDATAPTVALEKRIEEDLLGLLQAMRRLPPTTPPPPGQPLPSNPRDRERELNRLIAELKMIRLLQSRLNDDTLGVDKSRPEAPPLNADLRREIEGLQNNQEEIRDSLSQIGKRVESSGGPPAPTPAPNPGQVDR
jgi:hypothetical protein